MCGKISAVTLCDMFTSNIYHSSFTEPVVGSSLRLLIPISKSLQFYQKVTGCIQRQLRQIRE